MSRLRKVALALAMVVAVVLSVPLAARAADGDVAQIGDRTYSSIDDAIEEAEPGATIKLLQDVEATKTFYKSLTFTGGHKLTVDAYSWRYSGDLIFDGADFEMTVDSESPTANNGDIARWLGMALTNGSIVARNEADITFSFDSNSGTNCAIYATNADIIVENQSAFSIFGKNTTGVTGQGIQLDSARTAGIRVSNGSTLLIDGTNRGYVCSPDILVENSTFTVQNCTANASNGGKFTAINSRVTFAKNAGHGLSASDVTVQNSVISSDGNGYRGVSINDNGSLTVDGDSKLTITNNSWSGDHAGLKIRPGATAEVDAGAVISITNNYCSGLSNNGKAVFEEGVDLTITGNTNDQGGVNGSHGGGVYNSGSGADLSLPSDAVIYNNHSLTDGDDIYNSANSKITFGKVGDGWTLDGVGIDDVADDCTDAIDGWYDDSTAGRWEAHAVSADDNHVDEFEVKDETATVENQYLALKAAHDVLAVQVNKWASPTTLDESYQTDVTLHIGADQETSGADVVFVLDKSTSVGVKNEALNLLNELLDHSKQRSGIKIKVGVVTFNNNARNEDANLSLTPLSDETMTAIQQVFGQSLAKGTNIEAGIRAGMSMLDADATVLPENKHLVLVTDGVSYLWGTDEPQTIYNQFTHHDGMDLIWSSNSIASGLRDKEALKIADQAYVDSFSNPVEWLQSNSSGIGDFVEQYQTKWVDEEGYDHSNDPFVPNTVTQAYCSNDVALYMAGKAWQEAAGKGYQLYSFVSDKYDAENGTLNTEGYYPWAAKFFSNFSDIAGHSEEYNEGASASYDGMFDDVKNDILYGIKSGVVTDVIFRGESGGQFYNFDLTDGSQIQRDTFTLFVGGQEIAGQVDETNKSLVNFGNADASGKYPYTVEYKVEEKEENGEKYSEETLVWTINVPVEEANSLSLTYNVTLNEKPTDSGSYKDIPTNTSAILKYESSNGDSDEEPFPVPVVEYSIEAEPVIIQPADITIYMGGNENQGYEGVVTGEGGSVVTGSQSTSLPEPGYYLTLPEDINKELGGDNGPVNLGDHITLGVEGDDTRGWKLDRYGSADSTSATSSRFIYRISATGEGQQDVRLQFTINGVAYSEDVFEPALLDDLQADYEMSIYPGDVDQNLIYAEITTDEGAIYKLPVEIQHATLRVRYVNLSQDEAVTDVFQPGEGQTSAQVEQSILAQMADQANAEVKNAFASVPSETTFTINESSVDLDPDYNPAPSLLFDEVTSRADAGEPEGTEYADQLGSRAIAAAASDLTNPQYEARYLDLVDANNGNVWLKASQSVTVYWPYPEGVDSSYDFRLVHFTGDGLDRDVTTSDIASAINSADATSVAVEKLDHGVKFTTSSFSPFVLVWGSSNGGSGGTDPDYYGDLKVSKTVTGNLANLNDEFTFRVTVEGAGDQTYGGVKFTNNVATITLNGGETVTIKNLPKGAKYTVEEIDGLDYELVSSKNTSGTIPDGSVTASFVNDKSEPETLDPTDPVNPGGSKVLLDADGNPVALSGGEFTFKLTGLDGAPMPAGAVDGSITVTNRADGVFVFGDIVFDEAGTYTYELTEVAGTDEGIAYDGSTHTLVVVVSDEDADGDGKLDIASLTYDGESTLPTFTNETTSDEPPAPDPNQPGTDEPAEPTTPGVPDTGDHTVSALPAVLALGGVALVGGALAVARRRVR